MISLTAEGQTSVARSRPSSRSSCSRRGLAHAQAPRVTRRSPRASCRAAPCSTADDFVYRDTTLRGPTDTNAVAAGWVTRRLIGAGEVLRDAGRRAARGGLGQSNRSASNGRISNVLLTIRGIVDAQRRTRRASDRAHRIGTPDRRDGHRARAAFASIEEIRMAGRIEVR